MKYELINIGEIRFGPSFFKLMINGAEIKNRIFGEEKMDCSRFIVFQEWLSTEYVKGPRTRPFIIDKVNGKYATLSEGKSGFSEGFRIDGNMITYTQVNKGTGINKIYECDINALQFEDLFKNKYVYRKSQFS